MVDLYKNYHCTNSYNTTIKRTYFSKEIDYTFYMDFLCDIWSYI